MAVFDTISNRGEYFTAHYFAEGLAEGLRRGVFTKWASLEGDENESEERRQTPPRLRLPALRSTYFSDDLRTYFARQAARAESSPQDADAFTYADPQWTTRLRTWHQTVLKALGYEDGEPRQLTVRQAGRDHAIPVAYANNGVVALDCGWANDLDSALDGDGADRLLTPVALAGSEACRTGAELASFLFFSEEPPRFVLLLTGGVVVLADRHNWGEGRYLAANLEQALEKRDTLKTGELATIAALFSLAMLRPAEDGGDAVLDTLLKSSAENAVGVSTELRDGLRDSVELIANEVLERLRDEGVAWQQVEDVRIPFATELTRESLRYLYRILFLLFAEARPELGILPSTDGNYEAGYSILRLRELVVRSDELESETARLGHHLYESLDLLFTQVNKGHRPWGSEDTDDLPEDDEATRSAKAALRSEDLGLRFEPLRSELFDDKAIRLIGRKIEHPERAGYLDLRLRNETLHRVLRLLTVTKGKAGKRGGFISYRNLGINQLGAVYEGLMSYTGFVADERLYEVAKGGDPKDGSWMVPEGRLGQYEDALRVHYPDTDPKRRRGLKSYEPGEFVYRLAGRDRQTSASYYTRESLTRVTVELALKYRLDQERDDHGQVVRTPAADLLKFKICEPALGSGAFLNEAINQVASEYLRRREAELGRRVPAEDKLTELQKVKAYIALHNCYGVDLNSTAVELADVSLWLNTMHPGMRAPWFGLHLRRGNSLIGGRRAVYDAADVVGKEWLKAKGTLAPTELPFWKGGERLALPEGAVHQFLLPAAGWAAVAREKESAQLAPQQAADLAAWRKTLLKAPSAKAHKGHRLSQLERLQGLARRAEFLWAIVVQRMELSESEIARRIDIWGAEDYDFIHQPEQPVAKEKVYGDLYESPGSPFWRLKTLMDTWCALWFWPLDKCGLLDGSDAVYQQAPVSRVPEFVQKDIVSASPATVTKFAVQPGLFEAVGEQLVIGAESDDEAGIPLVPAGLSTRARSWHRSSAVLRRSAIPLKELADWIDFAESLLGTHDLEEGMVVPPKFASLQEVERFEDALPGGTGMEDVLDSSFDNRYPWLATAQKIAEERGFFHWEVDFAAVFARNGGFDLQIGNPPWVRPDWDENGSLAEFDPWFKLASTSAIDSAPERRAELLATPHARTGILADLVQVKSTSAFVGGETTFPLLGGTRPNLYRGFMIQVWRHQAHGGTAGLLHPDTHLEGKTEGPIRPEAYRRLRIHGSFVNGKNWAFPLPAGNSLEFGMHVYGAAQRDVDFLHASHIYGARVIPDSLVHDGSGPLPGIKYEGGWDKRAHRARIIRVQAPVLAEWQSLLDLGSTPIDETPLLHPLSTAEIEAMAALQAYTIRVGDAAQASGGFNEKTDRDKGFFREQVGARSEWREVILKGPNFAVATPFAKQSPEDHRQGKPANLVNLGDDAIPSTRYLRSCDRAVFDAKIDGWEFSDGDKRPATDYFRVFSRRRIADNSSRALIAALMPPGATHVDSVQSLAMPTELETLAVAGFFAGLPLDYFIRVTGRDDLRHSELRKLPALASGHPLLTALILRTMRLNCLTRAYAPLWQRLYDKRWCNERWALVWKGLDPLGSVSSEWQHATPLRNEMERRAALVEIDALVAVCLGMSSDALCAAYQSRYSVLINYEEGIWFDAHGRQIAGNHNAYGQGQNKQDWQLFEKYLEDKSDDQIPEGYTGPFYKADREREMRKAHSVFQARLNAAVDRGEWDPEKQIDPRKADTEAHR
ncbi:MAG TPA: DNA methyltransferase [Actinospica sp.]|jgi:hypothetical protein|nr:DNA methyltransferase [Actinospica sp.]